jgi:peptidyl-tRNA hydrolase, PTH2 family
MYIIVNDDLKMTKGKTCSQVAHITQLITEEIIRQGYETYPTPESYVTYMKWREHCTKIILKGSEFELRELMNDSKARYIIDDGQTQVKPGSLTVVGFGPNVDKKCLLKRFKLL